MMYTFLDDYQLPYAPGNVEDYSNLAVGFLGLLTGKIRGTTFEEQLEKVVFEPLKMDQTVIHVPTQHQNIAHPYDAKFKKAQMWVFTDATLGAGGIKSTLHDMLVFLEANLHLQSGEIYDALQLTHQTTQELNYPYISGLGWQKIADPANGTELIWHNGGTGGTVTFIGFVKELNIGVVLLFITEINERTNSSGSIELMKGIQVIHTLMEE